MEMKPATPSPDLTLRESNILIPFHARTLRSNRNNIFHNIYTRVHVYGTVPNIKYKSTTTYLYPYVGIYTDKMNACTRIAYITLRRKGERKSGKRGKKPNFRSRHFQWKITKFHTSPAAFGYVRLYYYYYYYCTGVRAVSIVYFILRNEVILLLYCYSTRNSC